MAQIKIFNFIKSARAAWSRQSNISPAQQAAGFMAIDLVREEYEKTPLYNQNLLHTELLNKIKKLENDLVVERLANNRLHSQLANKGQIPDNGDKLRKKVQRVKENELTRLGKWAHYCENNELFATTRLAHVLTEIKKRIYRVEIGTDYTNVN